MTTTEPDTVEVATAPCVWCQAGIVGTVAMRRGANLDGLKIVFAM